MSALRVLLVDDEELARDRLRLLLSREPDVEVAGECASGREAREALARTEVDVLFLDVQMPEVDGFGVLQGLAAGRRPLVVFVTAHAQHGPRAFEEEALDYLLKPFDAERLRATLQRARVRLRHQRRDALAEEALEAVRALRPGRNFPERLVVREGGLLTFVRVADLDVVEAAGNYVHLHCGEQTFTLRQTLAETEAQLDPARFVRVHRSAIVHVERIQALQPQPSGDYAVHLAGGRTLTLSRSYRDRLREVLGGAF